LLQLLLGPFKLVGQVLALLCELVLQRLYEALLLLVPRGSHLTFYLRFVPQRPESVAETLEALVSALVLGNVLCQVLHLLEQWFLLLDNGRDLEAGLGLFGFEGTLGDLLGHAPALGLQFGNVGFLSSKKPLQHLLLALSRRFRHLLERK
jgi:hypothetical protein